MLALVQNPLAFNCHQVETTHYSHHLGLNGCMGSPSPSQGLLMGCRAQSWKSLAVWSAASVSCLMLSFWLVVRACVCVCVCAHMRSSIVCEKASVTCGALHLLSSSTHNNTQHMHAHIGTHTRPLKPTRFVRSYFEPAFWERAPFTGDNRTIVSEHTHTHTHSHTHTKLPSWHFANLLTRTDVLKVNTCNYVAYIDVFSITARFTSGTTHRWTMVNTVYVLILHIIIKPVNIKALSLDFPLKIMSSISVFRGYTKLSLVRFYEKIFCYGKNLWRINILNGE